LVKTLLKLAIVAFVANATWHLWGAYTAHFKFKDAVQSASQFGGDKSEQELRERVLYLAGEYDVPVTESDFTITRHESHTVIDGAYTRPVDLAPGFVYRWPFTWHVDTFSVKN
jgi:hypothetical protein